MFNRISLKYRIALVIFLLEACMLSAVLWFSIDESARSAREQHTQTQNVILDLVTELTTSALLTEEYGDLQFYIEQLTKDPSIKQILLTGINDLIVVSDNINNIGKPVPVFTNSETTFWRSVNVDSSAGLLGKVHIQFSTDSILDATERSRNLGISIAIVGMSIILLVGIMVGFALTRRLDKVTRAAIQFTEGDISAQSGISGSDEVGTLGQTFDKMVNAVATQQQQLQQQILRNKTILATTQDGFFISDIDGIIQQVNQAFCRLMRNIEPSLLNKKLLDLFSADQAENIRQHLSDLTHNQFDHFELVLSSSENSDTHIDVSLSYVELNEEKFIFGFMRDITQRKLAEKDLQEHKDNLEATVRKRTLELKEKAQIIDQIHDSVISTDLNGTILSWNKGAERLFGYTEVETIGKPISIIYRKEDLPTINQRIVQPVLETGENDTELKLVRKNGEIFDSRVSLSLFRDEDGNIKRLVGYSLDISKRKQAERALQKRTQELEIANKELESFSYSVSHDLRSPLRSINGFCQILIEDFSDNLDEEAKDYLNRIAAGSVRMGKLIDDLLNLSRISRQPLKKNNVNLSEIAHTVLKHLHETNPERKVNININDKLESKADKDLMTIGLQNLLENAWKYTSKKPEANIEFGRINKDGSDIFYIRDNGAGFDMKYANKLFGAFQRLHKNEFEGTGIGLATVARIIHRHGGQIWAEAEVEKGATFFFTLN